MPFEGMAQRQPPTQFGALGPFTVIPHGAQTQYRQPVNWYGNSPRAHSTAALFSNIVESLQIRMCAIHVVLIWKMTTPA